MGVEPVDRRVAHHVRRLEVPVIPDVEQVVVSARGELGARRRPAEAADLLRVPSEGANAVALLANVVVDYQGVASSRREQRTIPRQR